MTETIRLAIIEDDPVIRESLKTYLGQNPSIQIELAAHSVENFLEEIKKGIKPEFDVMILDIGLPGMSGIQGLFYIRQEYPNMDVIMLTTFEEDDKIFASLCAGANSYVSKRTPLNKIMEVVFTVYRGGSFMSPVIARKIVEHFQPKNQKPAQELTERQSQIVRLICDGKTYGQVAEIVGISIDTVRDHIKKIYKVLEVSSKAELIHKTIRDKP